VLAIALRGLRANARRFTATLVAIITGVGFLAAGLIVTDSVRATLGDEAVRQYDRVSAAIQPSADNADVDLRIPAAVLDDVEALPEAAGAEGVLEGPLTVFDAVTDEPLDEGATGRLWPDDQRLNPLRIVEGRAPSGNGEIALDRQSADDLDIGVGARVELGTAKGIQDATVVGIAKFGGRDSLDHDGTISLAAPWAFELLGDGTQEYTEILVGGDTSPEGQESLVTALEGVTPSGFEVVDRETFLDQASAASAGIADVLRPVLVAFALLALFVCGFVIYNTFSVVVAQRTRELALLRAVGATPRQVKRSVRLEGLVVGLVGSALGLLAGVVLTLIVPRAAVAAGVDVPAVGVTIAPTTVVYCIVAGTVITVLSVLAPARRAARTSPIEALQSGAVDVSATSGVRRIGSLVLLGGGALLLIGGVALGRGVVVGAGVLAFVLGVLLGGPVLAVAFARIVRSLMARLGVAGRLADDNLVRNPRRTATTANALVIGVLLVAFVSTAGATMRDWAVLQLNRTTSADFQIDASGSGLEPAVLDRLGAIDGVTLVVPVRSVPVTIDGEPTTVSSGDLADLQQVTGLQLQAGSLEDLTGATIAVTSLDLGESSPEAGGGGPAMGDTVRVEGPGGGEDLQVVAELEFDFTTLFLSTLVPPDTFEALAGPRTPETAYLEVDDDKVSSVTIALDEVAREYPNISVQAGNVLGDFVGDLFDFLITAVVALLGMSVAIAVIGVVNTLSLSIFEQRREIGMLRAVGMVPREARWMIRLEAMLIAMLGTITGLVAGIFLAFMLTQSLGASFNAQWQRMLLVLVAGVIVGLLASLLPTRRVTRIDVLESLRA
jgi:putative ABC transport system permease protein